jgi:predicted cation transporter
MDLLVNAGLILIFFAVLILPFKVKAVEQNLETLLFLCGVLALTISGFLSVPGEPLGWSWKILVEALTTPLNIASVYGVPVGIVQIVLVVGLIIYFWYRQLGYAITKMVEKVPMSWIILSLIIVLGLISSIISAILAAILLVEIICAIPLERKAKVDLAVVACFSIGLGAGLTPLGEPLSTIVVSKMSGAPYHAGFDFLLRLLGIYIIPAIIVLGFIGLFFTRQTKTGTKKPECHLQRETIREVVFRAGKVYIFIMALVFLGEGFKPLILEFVIRIPSEGLYWLNLVSAVLDNSTLAAAEVDPALSIQQIRSALLGLLISGGMLIPGNIPNIIAAGKLEITSKEWARTGVPIGLAMMLCVFLILFIPPYLGLSSLS